MSFHLFNFQNTSSLLDRSNSHGHVFVFSHHTAWAKSYISPLHRSLFCYMGTGLVTASSLASSVRKLQIREFQQFQFSFRLHQKQNLCFRVFSWQILLRYLFQILFGSLFQFGKAKRQI
jgi:hypothetical protein